MNQDCYSEPGAVESQPAISPTLTRRLIMLLAMVAVVGSLLYAVGLFKHISYPLMWADESMTAVGAQRVLHFGYPKVHDGRNVFYDLRHSDPELGIEPRTDAYIGGAGWAQYYFAAPFVALAQGTADLYRRTALIRIPFACAGIAGLLILLLTGLSVLQHPLERFAVAALFVLFVLPSIPLLLHLREVRYYPLQLLLTVVALGIFVRHHLLGKIPHRAYLMSVVCLVPLLFLTFAPAALAFCLTIGVYLGAEWAVHRWDGTRERVPVAAHFRPVRAAFVGLIVLLPLAWFFRVFSISRQLREFYAFTFADYLQNLGVAWSYFLNYDVLLFALAAKLLLMLACWRLRGDGTLLQPLRLSLLLTLYGVIHVLFTATIPGRHFSRYFITLQPFLALSFALDLLLLTWIACVMTAWRRAARVALVALLITSLGWTFSRNLPFIKGRLDEISHQYQGALDFIIPYINAQYQDPASLVIATNYEETSYIFYLGSRVIVGFLNPDLPRDLPQILAERPDCVVFRRPRADPASTEIFQLLLSRDAYQARHFPVVDHGFNNIPEVVHWVPGKGWRRGHFFTTEFTDDPERQTVLFLRDIYTGNGFHPPQVDGIRQPAIAGFTRPHLPPVWP